MVAIRVLAIDGEGGKRSVDGSTLSIKVEPHVKQSFVTLCEELGLTASAAVNMFMRQMLRDHALPFTPSPYSANTYGTMDDIDTLAKTVEGLATGYPAITRVVLFGSLARGEATQDSDVDLRVVYDETSDFGLLGMASFSSAVEQAIGRLVDIVSAQTLSEDLAAAIERDGVLLYERS